MANYFSCYLNSNVKLFMNIHSVTYEFPVVNDFYASMKHASKKNPYTRDM